MRKLHAFLLLLGIVLLFWLLWRIGCRELWRELTALGWGLVPLVLCEGIAEMIHTVGWRFCLSGNQRHLPYPRLFLIRMAGYAINYLTPTAALGGEVSRAGLLSDFGPGTDAASGVLIDKACFALGHLLIVLTGSAFILLRLPLPPALRIAMMVAIAPMAVGIVSFVLLQKEGKLGAMVRWLAARRVGGPGLLKLADKLTAVDGAFRDFYRETPRNLWYSVAFHLLGFSVGILPPWLFLRLLGQPISLGGATEAWVLGLWFDLLTFAVPMNIGTLEGGRVVTFRTLGYGLLLGATYGFTMRIAQVSWTVFGLVAYAVLLRPARRAEAQQRSAQLQPPQKPQSPQPPHAVTPFRNPVR